MKTKTTKNVIKWVTTISAGLFVLVGLGHGSYLIISGDIVNGVKVIFLGIIMAAIAIGFNLFIVRAHERFVSRLLK